MATTKKQSARSPRRVPLIDRWAAALNAFFEAVTDFTRFTGRFFKELVLPPYEVGEVMRQCYLIGNKSLPLVGLTAFIMGLVFTMQSRPTLAKFGAQSWLPAMVAVAMIREIAPVITALICAGKVGSGIGAELGSMKVTEQIDAMEVAGNHPYKFLVTTRVAACIVMLPLLTIFSDSIALIGSFIGVNLESHTSFALFFSHVFESLDYIDLMPAVIKTFFFGLAIGIVSCYKGYNSSNGTEGVGRSANSAVVLSSLAIFVIDMVAVRIAEFFM